MRVVLAALLALALAACAPPPPAANEPEPPARPQRIVSLDYCADQFVLKLADRSQVLALSPDAAKDFSYMRAAATGLPQVRPSAEDVIALKPDLVARAYGGGANAAALLREAGAPVAQLGYAEDFEGVRANIRGIAKAVGRPQRGEALVAEMDRRLAAIRKPTQKAEALYLTPTGYTTGPGSLVDEVLAAAGLANFESRPGWRPIPLERLARERPALVAAAFFEGDRQILDAWSAARHPLARAMLKEVPVGSLEGAWTACGGWFLVEAVEALAKAAP